MAQEENSITDRGAPGMADTVPAEPVLGVIPAISRKKGLLSVESFNVVVTGQRLVFAVMTNDMVREEVQREGNAGFLAAMTVGYTFYKRYLNMTPDAALKENPQNFAVDISQIRKVKIFAGREIKDYHSIKANRGSLIKLRQNEKGKLEIETMREKLSFDVPNTSMDTALDALDNAGLL